MSFSRRAGGVTGETAVILLDRNISRHASHLIRYSSERTSGICGDAHGLGGSWRILIPLRGRPGWQISSYGRGGSVEPWLIYAPSPTKADNAPNRNGNNNGGLALTFKMH